MSAKDKGKAVAENESKIQPKRQVRVRFPVQPTSVNHVNLDSDDESLRCQSIDDSDLEGMPLIKDLIHDSEKCIGLISRSNMLLAKTYSSGSSTLVRSMGMMWYKVTADPRTKGRMLENDITNLIGDLWIT